MKVKVLYFAQVAEKVGKSNEVFEVEEETNTEELIKLLIQKYPVIEALTFNIAVDQELVRTAAPLKDGIEIALLPPFAGG